MPISVADLVAMREKIESDKKRLHDELEDLDKTLAAIDQLQSRLRAEKRAEQPTLDLGIAPPPPDAPRISFAESVRRAVRQFHDEEFTVANVENVLKAQRVPLPPRNLRTRIAIEIKDLLRKHQVVLAEKGSGNTPNRYRLLDSTNTDEGKSEGTSAQTLAPSIYHSPVRTPTLTA